MVAHGMDVMSLGFVKRGHEMPCPVADTCVAAEVLGGLNSGVPGP